MYMKTWIKRNGNVDYNNIDVYDVTLPSYAGYWRKSLWVGLFIKGILPFTGWVDTPG